MANAFDWRRKKLICGICLKLNYRHVTGRGRDVYIQSSRINDGICDCCDGSDEWLERDGVVPKCPHTCAEL